MAEQAGTEGERVLCQLLERSPFLPLALILLVMCIVVHSLYFFFFFQAEDGIRDLYVTGVQTCALPISYGDPTATRTIALAGGSHSEHWLTALHALGRAHGFKVTTYMKMGCPLTTAEVDRKSVV